MKSVFLRAVFSAAILSTPWIASSQQYYVVVGAFAADETSDQLRNFLPDAYMLSEKESLIRLYVVKTSDKQTAISKTLHLKNEMETFNTNLSETRMETNLSDPSLTSPGFISTQATTSASRPASLSAPNAGAVPPASDSKYFKFIIETPEGSIIPGKVHHVDFHNEREVAAYNTNTSLDLRRPGNNAGPMTIICGIFGYKEIEKNINYMNPSLTDGEAFLDRQGTWVIPYKLEPLERGDLSVMYNVSFYKDAVVMRKPSKADLDQLVTMMRENPYYEITIHSHCNGKGKREIIALGTGKNYFDVSGSTTIIGSAKTLTNLRAQAIQSYLTDHGIDRTRTRIFSWGSRDMLVKSNSPRANLNDRIEIEITRD